MSNKPKHICIVAILPLHPKMITSVEDRACIFDCELKVVTEHSQVAIRKQREGAALPLPGVVIFTDCRALVQPVGGSGREVVGKAVLLADYLQKTKVMRTVVQWLPSHVGIIGNEMDWPIKEGLSHSHGSHQLCWTLDQFSDAAPSNSGVRRSCLMMKDAPNSVKFSRKMT
ncbi:hypothetical protein PoB_007545300 [Plakobranchus ocellatus]|uniref:RNase H type-1 domain-containing protein n=1 Tax=Plakobranchus ocellatus TaxID=259542 RepID=A0AAV4DXG4_9GAST|nr:hypothetical protein PoB_007545300 [Plakobranchus ocellatus]